MKKILAFVGSLAVITIPVLVSAQGTVSTCDTGTGDLTAIVCKVKNIVNLAIPVAMAAAFIYFIISVIKFISAKDAEKRDDARNGVLQSIIGFACIVGLWGLVKILLNTAGANSSTGAPNLPTF